MSYCPGSPVPASPMTANFTELGADGSANSWAATLHHPEMTRSSGARSRVANLRFIRKLIAPWPSIPLSRAAHLNATHVPRRTHSDRQELISQAALQII